MTRFVFVIVVELVWLLAGTVVCGLGVIVLYVLLILLVLVGGENVCLYSDYFRLGFVELLACCLVWLYYFGLVYSIDVVVCYVVCLVFFI